MKKKIISGGIVLLILAVLLLPKLISTSGVPQQTRGNQIQRATEVSIEVMKPQPFENKIWVNGTILSSEQIELRSEISGKVIHIGFEEGRRVNKGDLLIKINDADLQAQLKKAEIKRVLLADDEFRTKELLSKNLTSQQNYDKALNDLNSQIAEIEYIYAQIAKTEIKAPFDGLVGLRSISEGSYVTPNIPIATLQKIDQVKIDFSISQKYFDVIKAGTQISIRLSGSAKKYLAKVYAIEPKIEQATRTLQVRAISPNNNMELLPGAYVEVEVTLEKLNDVIFVPAHALVPDLEGNKVYLFNSGKAVSKVVETGYRGEKQIQIINGLSAGDTVITSAIIQMRPGLPVQIKNNQSN